MLFVASHIAAIKWVNKEDNGAVCQSLLCSVTFSAPCLPYNFHYVGFLKANENVAKGVLQSV